MPPAKIGRCTVFGELASGGMATVYVGRLAGAAGFARRVAIKSLHAQYAKDPDFLAMFLDEARLSGRIQHPNVVRVLDVISSHSELHLVMEYIEGEALSKLMRLLRARGERLPLPIAVAVMGGVLDGLHAAHEARSEDGAPLQIVHRDVSPQNVLVGVDGLPRILDFGIAKAVGRMQTTRGDQLKGKLAYMAPEHLAREPLDRRADVYAAGIVLWELLTSERLFHAEDEISTFRRALEAKVDPPSTLSPEVPAALDQAVLRALAKQPNERFATARDFSRALEATGLAASASELADWVTQTARESLAERAQRLTELEQAVGSSTSAGKSDASDEATSNALPAALSERLRAEQTATAVPAGKRAVASIAIPTESQAPPSGQRRGLLPAVALLGLLGLPAAWWLARPSAPNATEPETPKTLAKSDAAAVEPASASTPALEATAEVPPPSPPKVASTSAGTTSPAPMSHTPSSRSKARSSATPTKKPKSDCSTPFTIDAHGVKVPKLECL